MSHSQLVGAARQNTKSCQLLQTYLSVGNKSRDGSSREYCCKHEQFIFSNILVEHGIGKLKERVGDRLSKALGQPCISKLNRKKLTCRIGLMHILKPTKT